MGYMGEKSLQLIIQGGSLFFKLVNTYFTERTT